MASIGRFSTCVASMAIVALGSVAQAVSPADKCEAAKLKIAGKYAYCRLKAESRAAMTGTAPDYTACEATYTTKWALAEARGGGLCPVNGDQEPIRGQITQCADTLAATIGGAPPAPACGNGTIDAGETCDQNNLNGQTCVTLGFTGGTLACGAGCAFDTSGCSTSRFVDNGDGTITDTETGLQWEKKDDAGGVRDKDETFSLTASGSAPDGTAFTVFLAELNNPTTHCGCFAGHCDWRLPTREELQNILLASCGIGPCIDPAFGPIGSSFLSIYWAYSGVASYGEYVSFQNGSTGMFIGTVPFYVRAVRSDG